jgi:hypothetical protein
MLFKELNAVYSENRVKHINSLSGQDSAFKVLVYGTHSNHCDLKGKRYVDLLVK